MFSCPDRTEEGSASRFNERDALFYGSLVPLTDCLRVMVASLSDRGRNESEIRSVLLDAGVEEEDMEVLTRPLSVSGEMGELLRQRLEGMEGVGPELVSRAMEGEATLDDLRRVASLYGEALKRYEEL